MLADNPAPSPANGGARLIQRGWLSANSIVLSSGHAPACVIDTGYISHAAQTVALIETALGNADLGRIVNTHLHSDHCGGNAALQGRWPAATITAPEGYRAAVAPWDEARLSFRETGQRCACFSVDGFLREGDELELGGTLWQVHAAPGHDPHALMFFEPRTRTLISGDALWERRLAIIFPELQGDSGFDQAYRALETIERLAPRMVLPGHGRAFSDVAGALARSRQRLERFVRLPQRHREHAARALVVYHMLEHRRRERAALIAWIARTPIFQAALGSAYPGGADVESAAEVVVGSLLDDGLLRSEGRNIIIPDTEV